MAEEFKMHRESELPATLEQVWAAVATGPGNLGWLFPMEIEPWEGGIVSRGPCTVTVWDPPRNFICRHSSDDGLSATLEYRLQARQHNSTVLHTVIHRVHSGTVGDAWEISTAATGEYTDFHHHTLDQYLCYFNSRGATFVQAVGPAAAAEKNAFAVLRQRLGLGDDVAQGEQVRLTLSGLAPLDAVVDYLTPHFIGLRTADGLYRFFGGNAWRMPVSLSHHLFANDIDQEKAEHAWRAWLDGVFTQPQV